MKIVAIDLGKSKSVACAYEQSSAGPVHRFETVPSTPEEFRDYARRETAKWAQVIKLSGAKID